MKKDKNYQDYVIQNGQFIGEFEKMYQNFEDPWNQSTREIFSIEKKIGIELLKKYGYKKSLEYGCGLGFYTRQLAEHFEGVWGVDVSKTAIKRAKQISSEVGSRKSEVGSRKSEVGSRKSEVGSRKSEVGSRKILWNQIYFVKIFLNTFNLTF